MKLFWYVKYICKSCCLMLTVYNNNRFFFLMFYDVGNAPVFSIPKAHSFTVHTLSLSERH